MVQVEFYKTKSIMKLLWLLFMLQTLPTMCASNTIQLLVSTFHYNFSNLPNIGQVIVWQVLENSMILQPQIYKRKIPTFHTDRTYLLFTQSQPKQICIYYWVGSTVSLISKQSAAMNALKLYLLLNEYIEDEVTIILSREEEFLESESFENTVNFVDRMSGTENSVLYHQYVDNNLPSKLPNLYILRGKSTTRIKLIPMGIQWLINDACLILETGYKVEELNPVSVYCGPNTSITAKLRVWHMAHVLYLLYTSGNAPPQVLKTSNPVFKAFIEILENKDNCRSHEVDDSNDYLKDADTFVADRDKSVSFYRFHQSKMIRHSAPKKLFSSFFIYNEIVGVSGSHLLDTGSVAGVFLHIYHGARVAEKLRGLEMAEEYLHNRYSLTMKPTRMRIMEVKGKFIAIIDLAINLIDFPSIRPLMEAGVLHW